MARATMTDRPRECERGPDCLVHLLMDFLSLELPGLTPETFAGWVTIVAECIWSLNGTDGRNPERPFRADRWLELVSEHIAGQFPNYPGGMDQARRDFTRLMLASRRDGVRY